MYNLRNSNEKSNILHNQAVSFKRSYCSMTMVCKTIEIAYSQRNHRAEKMQILLDKQNYIMHVFTRKRDLSIFR